MHRFASMFLCTLLSATGKAQDEHPFLEYFGITVQEGRVLLDWTMVGGSTCDGSEVERSTDGESFSRVHRIEGLCGDPDVSVPFEWSDEDPPELSTLFYRIVFGSEGRSSVKSVRFAQLTTSAQRFFPSPTDGQATLLLNVSASATVDLVVRDLQGRTVMELGELNGREHHLDVAVLHAGTYTYVAEADGRRFSGRFVKY